jgi:Na+/phosphate symporter
MEVLDKKVPAEPLLLFIAGAIMVLTLWFSKKAKTVAETEIGLSRQTDTHEKFEPNLISRYVVRGATQLANYFSFLIPKGAKETIEQRFKTPEIKITKDQSIEAPAFDLIRASVNLMVAGILIAIATTMKLPLSTTYVTFMVAMGTSFADRAWGRESAVYRVSGVLNVIAGWFATAFGAFAASGVVLFLINWNPTVITPILILLTVILLYRNYLAHKKIKLSSGLDSLKSSESSSVQGVVHESAKNISIVIKRSSNIYTSAINGLALEDVAILKKNKKQIVKLSSEVDELRDNIFYFIKNLDDSSIHASNFYINILGYLHDMSQSLEYITKVCYKHVNNNHKKLKFSQYKELKEVYLRFEEFFEDIKTVFDNRSFDKLGHIINTKQEINNLVVEKIQKQVERTRQEESSPKNTTLYFNVLVETKDLLNATTNLLVEYHDAHGKTS